jgi:TM2 domain-containing membrane protein YozV
MNALGISTKSRLATLLLCFFLGFLGAHRFYVGKTGTALLMIITAGGLGVWWLVDLIFIGCGMFRDKEEKKILNWFEPDCS